MSVRSDGVKTYRGEHDFYLERKDGQFANCWAPNTASQPWLYCSARETLVEGLVLKYSFRTTEATFLKQSTTAATNAHAIFDSLRHKD